MSDGPAVDESTKPALPVSERVFAAFLDAVAAEPELEEVASRLRATILGQNSLSEPALRRALFGDDAL